jgi:hypothetical protein
MTKSHDDLTLDELLGDPMTQAIARADRVDPAELEAMLRSLAREIGGRPGGSAAARAPAASATRFDRKAAGRPLQPIGLRDPASTCAPGSRSRSQQCGVP